MEDDAARQPEEGNEHTGDEPGLEPTPWMPAGWVYRGDGIARPDPDHPTYPAEHFRRREKIDLNFLLNDPHTTQVLDTLFERFAEPFRFAEYIRSHPTDLSPAQLAAFTSTVSAHVSQSVREAMKTPPAGIPVRTYAHYLINRIMVRFALTWEDATAPGEGVGNAAEPVMLLFNPTSTITQIDLHPNQFAGLFTHAARADRRAYDDLMDATQEELGYAVHRDPGGNIPDHAGNLAVARLRATLGAIHHQKIADQAGLGTMTREGLRLRRSKGDKLAESFYGPRGMARFKKARKQRQTSEE